MKRAFVLAITLCAGVSSALAKPSTTVFPLSAPNLPMKIASAPEELSKALAEELGADVAKMPVEDAALIAGCDPGAPSCLETVSKQHKSKRIVFGTISMIDESRLKVTLTRFDPGPELQQRTFTVEGDVEEMAEELIKLSRSLFDGSDPDLVEDDDPEEIEKPPGGEEDPIQPPAVKGEISPTTIVILVSGGAALVTGVGFLYSSSQIGNEVSGFKPRTEADFKELIRLENKGAQRQMIGGVLVGVSVVALGYGAIRAMMDRSSSGSSSTETSSLGRRFTPVPLEGGGALVFSMELP